MDWLPSISNYLPYSLFGLSSRNRDAETAIKMAAPFLSALEQNNTYLVRIILQSGVISPDIPFLASNGMTPLHITCSNDCLSNTKLLLEHGANPAARDNHGTTVLMQAASMSSPQILRELLMWDRSLLTGTEEFTDFKGVTLLQYAMYGGRYRSKAASRTNKDAREIVEIVLSHGAGKAACKKLISSWTDASSDLMQLVSECLGTTGIDPKPIAYKTVCDYLVQHCLIHQAAVNRQDLLRVAVEKSGANLNFIVDFRNGEIDFPTVVPYGLCGNKDGLFSMSLAAAALLCRYQDPAAAESTMRCLQSLGAPLDIRDRHGFTPAFWAAALGQINALRFLLTDGRCSASARSHTGLTLAHLCCSDCPDQSAVCATLQLIVKRGGPLDRPDKAGRSPVQLLMERDFVKAVRYLSGHRGCNANRILNSAGISLIGFAVQQGWEPEVKARLACEHRADWMRQRRLRERQHQQLIDLATEAGQLVVLESLLVFSFDRCSDEFVENLTQRLLPVAVQKLDAGLLNLLSVRFGADLNAVQPGDGETLLTRATAAGNLEQVQLLLDAGASIAALNSVGESVEMLAARCIRSQSLFAKLMELFLCAEPQLWPTKRFQFESAAGQSAAVLAKEMFSSKLDIQEREVVLPMALTGLRYRVVKYTVHFSQPVNLFRKSRQDQLPVLTEIIEDIRQRIQPQKRLSMRALPSATTTSVQQELPMSADWPDIEYAVGISASKLRELLCQLHHLLTLGRLNEPVHGFAMCLTVCS